MVEGEVGGGKRHGLVGVVRRGRGVLSWDDWGVCDAWGMEEEEEEDVA